MPTLTLMCGLPRVGKSTWIEKNKGDAVIVSPDDIRSEIFGHQFHSEANKFVFALAEAMVILLLKQGKDVIVDATHITDSLRDAWSIVILKCEANARVIWVYADKDPKKNLDICLERNAKSPNGEKLPEADLRRMARVFQEPTDSSWYKLVKSRNPSKSSRSVSKT